MSTRGRTLIPAMLLACAGLPGGAEAVFVNGSSRAIYLDLKTLHLEKAILKIQVHATGQTPKPRKLTVAVDDFHGRRKAFLSLQDAKHKDPREITLTPDTNPDGVPQIRLEKGASIRIHPVAMDLSEVESNLVVFSIAALEAKADDVQSVIKPQNLDVVYAMNTDKAGEPAEKVYGKTLRNLGPDGLLAPYAFRFQDLLPKEGDALVLADPIPPEPAGGCGCAIL